MKAILTLNDMPKNCAECLLHYDYMHCIVFENMSFEPEKFEDLREGYEYTSEYCDYRPPLCPLKPMPQKLNATEIAIEIEKFKVDDKLMYQVEGWNRCLDEILGGNK